MINLKRIKYILIATLCILFFYYLNKTKSIEYQSLKKLIKDSVSSNCASPTSDVEYKLLLSQINSLLNEIKYNYNQNSQNQGLIGESKLNETLEILEQISNTYNKSFITHNFNDEEADIKYHMKIYDLNQANDNNFECVQSKQIVVQTTICIHDVARDRFVSSAIKGSGVWEEGLVRMFMRMLNSDKDINVLDIGAQLGQYGLYAGKLGRKVIAVEPFYDNYIRLHKSIVLENLQNKFILITNGVTDKRGEFKRLQSLPRNAGGQGLLNDSTDYASRMNETSLKNDRYVIETILMDDLVQILPKDFDKVIMKIDIEGYEMKAFQKASKLLSKLNILAIFMEWTGKTDTMLSETNIEEFLEFFYSRNFECRHSTDLQVLPRDQWKTWPRDIIFTKKDFNF